MPLALWIGGGCHFFVDTFLDCDVQVGQAYQKSDGSWTVEINDEYVEGVANLDAAKRLFVEKYDRSLVRLSPMSLSNEELPHDFTIIDLTPLQKPVGRARRAGKRKRRHRR